MFADLTGFDSTLPALAIFIAIALVGAYWPTWQKQLQAWEQQRKEHRQKVETLLTEIRDSLRQKS